jgi:hypothetical protein
MSISGRSLSERIEDVVGPPEEESPEQATVSIGVTPISTTSQRARPWAVVTRGKIFSAGDVGVMHRVEVVDTIVNIATLVISGCPNTVLPAGRAADSGHSLVPRPPALGTRYPDPGRNPTSAAPIVAL